MLSIGTLHIVSRHYVLGKSNHIHTSFMFPLRTAVEFCNFKKNVNRDENTMPRIRDFVTTRVLVHKHVKISVDEWILETTHPHKHVSFWNILSVNKGLLHSHSVTSLHHMCGELISVWTSVHLTSGSNFLMKNPCWI